MDDLTFWLGIIFVVVGLLLSWRNSAYGTPGIVTGAILLFVFIVIAGAQMAFAHDPGGKYAQLPLHDWFDSLRSGKGPCCSDADGTALSDVDWESNAGHYRVRIEGMWYDVPEDAILKQPNLYGRTMVWPIYHRNFGGMIEKIDIRCFIPGMMT